MNDFNYLPLFLDVSDFETIQQIENMY